MRNAACACAGKPKRRRSGKAGANSSGQVLDGSEGAEKHGKQKTVSRKERRNAKQKGSLDEKDAGQAEAKATTCSVCGEDFETRNRLFQHIKKSGHAVLKRG